MIWKPLRYIDLEQWVGRGMLVWVPRQRTVYAAYLDTSGIVRVWHQGNGPDDVIEGATQYRAMPTGPVRQART